MKKKFGFSLAEMMIVMLIVAIVLAATAPMITRKVSRERSDKIFDMLNVDPTNAVEYVKGRNQRIYMNAREDGYVGIRENGDEIPKNSVLFGYNKYNKNEYPVNFVGIGFNTLNKKDTVVIGYNASAEEDSVVIGNNAKRWEYKDTGTGVNTVIIGHSAMAGTDSVAIGYNAQAVPKSVALGYKARTTYRPKAVAIGYNAYAGHENAVAIGYNAETKYDNTIVLGTKDTTVYIPGNLVVEHAALIGRAAGRNDNLYFRPYAQEDGRHFAVLNAGDWKGEDSNITMAQYATNTDYLGVEVGPYSTNTERWRSDYKDNNRTHIYYTDPTKGDNPGSYKYSDIRLKNVGEVFNSGLEELNKLTFYNYTFKDDKNNTPHVGVIAQDLQKVFPNAVTTGENGYLKIRWDEMFYSVINAVKELNLKISTISDKVKNLSIEFTNLKSTVEKQQVIIDNQQTEIKDLSARIEKLENHNK